MEPGTERTPEWRPRPGRLLLGILVLACIPVLLRLLDGKPAHPMPLWTIVLWSGAPFFCIFAGIFLLGIGLGFFNTELLAATGEARAPTASVFIAVYVGSLLVLVILATVLSLITHIHPVAILLTLCGILFLIASTGKPWWLFGTLRRCGWFANVERDTTMRWLLAGIGAACVLVPVVLVLSGVPLPAP